MERDLSPDEIHKRILELGDWFQNINLRGVWTAPEHYLGDYPTVKWSRFSRALPTDLSGKTVLDVGCNAGFYSIEMKRRGAARVIGIDHDGDYLEQARFAATVCGVEIEFRELSVYDVAELRERFDIVLFLGVLYHLRHPLLALDLLYEHVAGDLLVFQSMLRGSHEVERLDPIMPSRNGTFFFSRAFQGCALSNIPMRAIRRTGGSRTRHARKPCCAVRGFG